MSYVKKPSVVKIDPTVTHLQPDQFDNDDPIQGYPFGTSAMRVTAATGFPETSGDVITSRTTDGTGSQIFVGEKAYIRTFEASAWSSWRELGESGGGGPVEWDDIINKPSQFPPSPHMHVIEDTIGLQEALNDKASAQSVNELQQEVDEHKADNAAHGIGDRSALLTTAKDTLVNAINELFTFANDGKTGIAAVIGSPATSGDTFSQLRTHIQNAKNTMASNLAAKGVSASGTEALQALAAKIANISTGKRWASGTATSSSTTNRYVLANGSLGTQFRSSLSVNGLSFKPSLVFIIDVINQRISIYTEIDDGYYPKTVKILVYGNSEGQGWYENYRGDVSPANVFNGGFSLPVANSNTAHIWMAIE